MLFSDEELALIEAIHADPKSDAPRLIYADWLEDKGDRRGQFIRVQCAERPWIVARSKSGFGRTQPKSWDTNYNMPPWPEPIWHRLMPAPLELSGYSRGLALLYYPPTAQTPLTTKDWDRILTRVTPAARLSVFLPYSDTFRELVIHPLMGRVDILAIANFLMPRSAVEDLARCPYLSRITALNMRNLDEEAQKAFDDLIKPIAPFASTAEVFHAGGAMYSMEYMAEFKRRREQF